MASRAMDIFVFGACIGMVFLISYGMFGKLVGGGMSPLSEFPWHPVMMTSSFAFFMVMGRWSYCADPSWGLQDKGVRRWLHAFLMGFAFATAIAGYVFIFLAHLPAKKFFGYNFAEGKWEENGWRVAHALLGYVALTLAFAQAVMGPIKMMYLASGKKRFTFHGTLGKVIIVIGGINIGLSIVFWSWDNAFKILIAFLTIVTTFVGVTYPTYTENKSDEETPIYEAKPPG